MLHEQRYIAIVYELSFTSPYTKSMSSLLPSMQLHPGSRLQWRRCADAPVEVSRACAVVVGESVYVGGGITPGSANDHQVFRYRRWDNEWDSLPLCPVRYFAAAQFEGNLIAVGGMLFGGIVITGKVHTFTETGKRWESLLPPMPTARCDLSVVTTSAVIIAAGGNIADVESATVEVYSSYSSQWHTADPLPSPCSLMSSVIIDNTCYLLGGVRANTPVKYCFSALILDENTHPGRQLPHIPLSRSTALPLRGTLLTVGGRVKDSRESAAVYAFLNDEWTPLPDGNLPAPRSYCAAASLSPDQVIVVGGWADGRNKSNAVWIGELAAQ